MKVLQAGIASFLFITLVAALPGLYRATEYSDPFSGSRTRPEAEVRKLDLKTLAGVSKPEPEPERLPETTFSLEPRTDESQGGPGNILKVDINTAGKEELQTISGVGESTAEKILEYRQKHGSFNNLAELDRLPGIGTKTIRTLGQQILIDGETPEVETEDFRSSERSKPHLSINLNTALESELTRLDGIGPATAQKIIKYRRKNGPLKSVDELSNVKGIGPATVEKLRRNTVL